MVKIAPSILSADFANLIDDVNDVRSGGADYLHIDVMDGIFVKSKNLSIKELIKYINQSTKKNDVHLMVKNPEKYIEQINKN